MTPESYQSMQTETSGEFGGLGIEVSMEAGVIKVITPMDDSPAAEKDDPILITTVFESLRYIIKQF